MMRISVVFMIMMLLSGAEAKQQTRSVTGVVTDANTGQPLEKVSVKEVQSGATTATDRYGKYTLSVTGADRHLSFTRTGYVPVNRPVNAKKRIDVALTPITLTEQLDGQVTGTTVFVQGQPGTLSKQVRMANTAYYPLREGQESYGQFSENKFTSPEQAPLSTFAVDVDAASYGNIRRYINNGTRPPKDAVRVEEMINYFQYDIAAPKQGDPVRIVTELAGAPWNSAHQLMRVTLKAKDIPTTHLAASNFVFLIDVSGSMMGPGRLPLVKSSLKLLVDQLRDQDRVAIVTYAGSAAVKLPSISGREKMKIKTALDELEAGGSTAGGAGIRKAYEIAREHQIVGGNNRIILASDGDFNVGASSDEAMEDLIARESKSGISLTVLGFGMGNLKDRKMEILADKGHGNYAYVDNLSEARKAMVTEFGATLFTVAKDVKIQVEFNPAYVQAYRLVGYENRLLEAEDFNDDQKMGGDMGVGHTVTAFYELIPVGVKSALSATVDPLKYQDTAIKKGAGKRNGELATVKFRYKDPGSDKSQLQQQVVHAGALSFDRASTDFRFAVAVAELGMLLRDSAYKQHASYEQLIGIARMAKGKDEEGYRAEFIRLAENAKALGEGVMSDVGAKYLSPMRGPKDQ